MLEHNQGMGLRIGGTTLRYQSYYLVSAIQNDFGARCTVFEV